MSDTLLITPDILLNAYCQGVFPMHHPETNEIYWYSPNPRGIIPLDSYKPKKSLQNILNRKQFTVTFNEDFEIVIQHCANRKETWINEEIKSWYLQLFHIGYAHSVETRKDGKLVGGLYGVSIGGAFFGESMFSLAPNGSKIALHYLIEHLRRKQFILLDTQFTNPHLEFLGAKEIPKKLYMKMLTKAIHADTEF